MEAVQQYEDKVAEAETRLEQVKAELAGNGGEANPQEEKLNLVEQILTNAMMQPSIGAKEVTEISGETPKAMDEETQPMQTEGGNKRQKPTTSLSTGRPSWHWCKQYKSSRAQCHPKRRYPKTKR